MAVIDRCCCHGGQRHGEARALTDRAVAGDRAVVLAHDAIGDRQAEAGALADRFGGEERIVDARDVFAGNPGARIGDFDHGAVALETGGNRQPATARHRVLGIQEEIEEHLLQLVLHADDDHRRVGQLPSHLDAVQLELVLEQAEHVADDGVQIDWSAIAGAGRRPAAPVSAAR